MSGPRAAPAEPMRFDTSGKVRTFSGNPGGMCHTCGTVTVTADNSVRVMNCRGCGTRVRLTLVEGYSNGQMPCDGRCQYAVSPWCSCSCGGRNHRAGYIDVQALPAWVDARDVQRHRDKLARQAAAAARRRTAEQEAADAGREALLAQHPELAALAGPRGYQHVGGFAGDMAAALAAGNMSRRQIAASLAMIDRDDRAEAEQLAGMFARVMAQATGQVAPRGRGDVTGQVERVWIRTVHTTAGERCVWRMRLRLLNGCTVAGTVPDAAIPHEQRGRSTTFEWLKANLPGRWLTVRATFAESSTDPDPLFAKFVRPQLLRDADTPPPVPA